MSNGMRNPRKKSKLINECYLLYSILCIPRLSNPHELVLDNILQKLGQNPLQEIHLLRPSSMDQAWQWLDKMAAHNLGTRKTISTGGSYRVTSL